MQKKGFTLLELIIVVVILGILASFALPRYFRAAEKARAAEAISALGAYRSAQVRYRAERSAYSAVCGDLDMDMSAATLTFFGAPVCRAALSESATLVDFTRSLTPANPIETGVAGQYRLGIYGNGTICCTNGTGGTLSCAAIGAGAWAACAP